MKIAAAILLLLLASAEARFTRSEPWSLSWQWRQARPAFRLSLERLHMRP